MTALDTQLQNRILSLTAPRAVPNPHDHNVKDFSGSEYPIMLDSAEDREGLTP